MSCKNDNKIKFPALGLEFTKEELYAMKAYNEYKKLNKMIGKEIKEEIF